MIPVHFSGIFFLMFPDKIQNFETCKGCCNVKQFPFLQQPVLSRSVCNFCILLTAEAYPAHRQQVPADVSPTH